MITSMFSKSKSVFAADYYFDEAQSGSLAQVHVHVHVRMISTLKSSTAWKIDDRVRVATTSKTTRLWMLIRVHTCTCIAEYIIV